MRGKREKARQGKIIEPRHLPAWLKSPDGGASVVLDPHWAEVARLIWHLFLSEGLTVRAVAHRLTLLGHSTPSGGSHWSHQVVQTWLRNPAAKGEFCQLRFRSVEPRRHRTAPSASPRRRPSHSEVERPAEEWSRIPVPALVDAATWQAAQERLQRKKALASRNAHRFYLLSGLVVCGGCGRRMAGMYKRGQHSAGRYYQCTGQNQRRVDGSGFCDARLVNADRAEGQVWGRFAGLLRNPDQLEQELHRRRQVGSPTRDGLKAQGREVRTRLETIPAELDRLVEGYGKDLIPDDLMKTRMTALQAERKALAEQVDAIGREVERLESGARAEAAALEFARRIAVDIDDLDDQGRQALHREVVQEIVVHGDRFSIRTVLPIGDDGDDGHPRNGLLCPRSPGPVDLAAADADDIGSRHHRDPQCSPWKVPSDPGHPLQEARQRARKRPRR